MTVDATLAEPAERGHTTIAQRTVERLAAQAVTELRNVGGSARRMFGVAIAGEEPSNAARISANILGPRATLDVRISVVYPASVGATTDAVRAHLMSRVEELTGIGVNRVNITVTALHNPSTTRVGRVR